MMKPARAKVPATAPARKLLAKLEVLAARPGTTPEGIAAERKLARLKAKYDFTAPDVSKEGLFAGSYQTSPNAQPIISLTDLDLASWVKWAIEEATGIRCLFRGQELLAQATPRTAEKLAGIGQTIASGFTGLWDRYRTFPTVAVEDRGLFLRGLYDGMMNQQKPTGERLPERFTVKACRKAKKRAVGHVAGIGLHPYAVAVDLGRQIRFNVPLPEITNQLEALKPKEISA